MFTFPKNVVAAMSTMADGTMILPREGEDTEHATENRARFFASLKLKPDHVASARLHHRAVVDVVGASDGGKIFSEADGLVTDAPNIALSVTGADCLPLYFFDPKHNAIGICHAGWRGLVQNIPAAVVNTMADAFGTAPSDLLVGIGPGICRRHFDVHDDVAQQFHAYSPAIVSTNGTITIDLKVVAQMQLQSSGVLRDHIAIDPTCTVEDTRYFSYRRDHDDPIRGGMAIIALRALPFSARTLH